LLDGCFVAVWEGTDGSGKTTLRREVEKRLKKLGYRVASYKTPSRTATGLFAVRYGNRRGVDPLVRMLLFLANTIDDSGLMAKKVMSSRPDFFFIDRYYLCSVVYGLALLRRVGREVPDVSVAMDLVEKMGGDRLIRPDLYIIVDVNEEERLRRIAGKKSSDRPVERDTETQNIIRKIYEDYRAANPERAILVMNEAGKLEETGEYLANLLISRRSSTRQ
jgi:dTMP kinase